MTIDRASFWTKIRTSKLSRIEKGKQDGINAIFDRFEASGIADVRFLAYMFATTYHETAATMMPVEEYRKGFGRRYGKKIKQSGVSYIKPDQIYYGRGFVQLTWYENYEHMGRLLNLPLLEKPELALTPVIAADILVEGMTKGASSFGDFTGVSLERYFNSNTEDAIGARKIINGTDKAELIAQYYGIFKDALWVIMPTSGLNGQKS